MPDVGQIDSLISTEVFKSSKEFLLDNIRTNEFYNAVQA